MKEAYWGYWLVILGVFIIGVMLLVNNISTTNTNDYYNIKEVTQASMIDAVDYSYYRLYGNIKMSEQKFVENFIRRFADNVTSGSQYKIEFYDLYEVPPKVSVKISTNSNSFNVGASTNNDYSVTTTLTAILELGASDGSDQPTKKTDSNSCQVYAYTTLMDYFSGKTVKGLNGSTHSLSSDGISYTNQSALETAAKTGDMTKFKDELAKAYGSYLNTSNPTNLYNYWPSSLKHMYEMGWLRVWLS